MASTIRIKRSETSGNPSTLATGELAYSALTDNGSNGGDRLYIGIGSETNGNAANHIVIGGKAFTDKLDHTPGTLTASSAIIVDSNSKIDELHVDNITLNGNTISTTNTNGDLVVDPNGTGKVEISSNMLVTGSLTVQGTINATITGSSDSAGKWTTARDLTLLGDGSATFDNVDGSGDVSAQFTLATVNSAVGTYGSSTAIPVITVNAKGLITGVSTATISTSLGLAGDTGTDTVSLLTDTLNVLGSGAINTAITNNTITISAEDATTANKGVASFNSTDFSVTSGSVTLNAERIEDIVGAMISSNTESGISVTYDDDNGKLDFNVNDPVITIAGDVDGFATMTNLGNVTITVALDTVNSNTGSFGSSTQIPVITVNDKGLVTAVSTQSISTSFTLAADSGTNDTFSTGETLTFTGGEGIDTSVTNNTITISAEDATTSNKGVASFNSSGFDVTSGAVSLKGSVVQSISTDGTSLTPSSNTIAIYGGEGIDTSIVSGNITISGEDATTTNKGIASFDSADFDVTSGAVSIKSSGVSNTQLEHSSITIGSTSVTLGNTQTSFAGLTELTVDNLNFNGNEISSTDTNGDIILNPNGTGHVDVSGAIIKGVGTPVNGTDAANKTYVDNKITGLTWKTAVNLLANSNVALTGTSGTLVIDGHTALDDNDDGYRILLKNQNTATQNGIYVYTDDGSNYTLTRATDSDTVEELVGSSVFVSEGTVYGNTGWVQTADYPTTFGDLVWVQFSGAGAYSAGDGLTLDGTTFNVGAGDGIAVTANAVSLATTVAGDGLHLASGVINVGGTTDRISVSANAVDIAATYEGQTSITTLGSVTTGTWNASTIATTKGGTGLTSYATGDLLYASAADTLSSLTKPGASSLLTMTSGGTPSWTELSNTGITGLGTVTTGTWSATTIATTKGGTGLTSYATGDLLYASASNTLSKLSAGIDGQILQLSSGVPVWGDIDGGTY